MIRPSGLTLAIIGLAAAIALGIAWPYLYDPGRPPPEKPGQPAAPVVAQTARVVSKAPPDSAIAELERLREIEREAFSKKLDIEGKEAESALKFAQLGDRNASARARSIWGELLESTRRDYQEAERRRADLESKLRAEYGPPPWR